MIQQFVLHEITPKSQNVIDNGSEFVQVNLDPKKIDPYQFWITMQLLKSVTASLKISN